MLVELFLTQFRPDLTVGEHIRIFSDLKCLSKINDEVIHDLAKGVDLSQKLHKQAKTLSGGQKRKLQMAMMFAGGSAVCCVDEVSTGLDPISRRRIWEILLAERGRRTIILTTHYLDEADFLADDIAIMYKGSLSASGTSATLKHSYGDGYTVKLPFQTNIEPDISGTFRKEQSRHQTVYRVATAALAAELAGDLDSHNIRDYQISGPTMEELFIKITGETIQEAELSSEKGKSTTQKAGPVVVDITDSEYDLTEGKPISVFKQWWILLCKRCRILKRRWVPYFVAVAFAIVGAGVAPLLIKNVRQPIVCPQPADLIYDYSYRNDFGTKFSGGATYPGQSDLTRQVYVFGPADKLDNQRLDLMANVYGTNYTRKIGTSSYGYSNGSQIQSQLLLVNTYDEFRNAVRNNWQMQIDKMPSYYRESARVFSPYATIKGGVWLGNANSKPSVLISARNIDTASQMMNMLTILSTGVPISASYYSFPKTKIPSLVDLKPLIFIIYYGLIMCWLVLCSTIVCIPTDKMIVIRFSSCCTRRTNAFRTSALCNTRMASGQSHCGFHILPSTEFSSRLLALWLQFCYLYRLRSGLAWDTCSLSSCFMASRVRC